MLQRAHGQPVQVSVLLAELVTVSLRAARVSDGDVDPISRRDGWRMLTRDKPNEPGIPPRGGRSAASRSRDGLTHQHLLGAGLNLDDRIILRAVRRDSPAATRPSLDGPGWRNEKTEITLWRCDISAALGASRCATSCVRVAPASTPGPGGPRYSRDRRAYGCVATAAACPDHRLHWEALKGSSPSPVVDMLEPWRVPGGRAP
ncbi:MAG: hypothetical protein JWP76_3268 [Dactylosporangium sp.]|jgi:hypothetical protein|nr:hypothetical protein [Dactylosporangium sp.]